MGSDSGNWPLWTTFYHGVGAIMEMELLEEAELSRADVLFASTLQAARMVRMEKEFGSITIGKSADMVLLSGNPLAGFKVLRDPVLVIRNGLARAPADWLH